MSKHLDLLISSQEEQLERGTLTESGKEYLNGLKRARFIINESKDEYIICAANYYNDGNKHIYSPHNLETGFVITGRRHRNCCRIFDMTTGFYKSGEANYIKQTEIKGFITNKNRFVDRKEAYSIAFAADQIIGPNKGYAENEIGLTSEDLY